MGKPTAKMISFAKTIEIWSQVPIPKSAYDDFEICSDYIAKNKCAAYRREAELNRYAEEQFRKRGYSNRTSEFIGGDYGIGNNDMGISCFDFGIFPWGNS